MAVTKMGLGGPIASFDQGGGGPAPIPDPVAGGNFLLLGVRLLLLALLPYVLS